MNNSTLWLGLAAQLTTLAVITVAGADWYDPGLDAGIILWISIQPRSWPGQLRNP